MDDLGTSSNIQPKIDTYKSRDIPTSVLAQFPGLQQTKKYFPILPQVWSLPAFPFYIFQMQTFTDAQILSNKCGIRNSCQFVQY